MIREKALQLYRDTLFLNSFYLMISAGILAGFGFFFWILCSHLFSAPDIGLATSLISAAALVSSLGAFGFNNVIIRFLSSSERKNGQLSTAYVITTLASMAAATIFLFWATVTGNPSVQSAHFWLLALIFLVYVFAVSVNNITDSAFIAYRATKYVLYRNILLSVLKLSLPLVLIGIGFAGIVGSFALATLAACTLGFVLLIRKFDYRPSLSIDSIAIKETRLFAASNYGGNLFSMLPSTLLPLIILSRLGAQEAAFFYMPMMIVALLNVIPGATAQSFFAEVSHDESGLMTYFGRAVRHLFLLLVPAVVVVMVIGGFVLSFFGHDYVRDGLLPLQILAVASLVGAGNYLGDTLLNIKKFTRMYIFMNALNALVIVGLAYAEAPHGLAAVAWSVLIGQVVTLIVYMTLNRHLLYRTLIASSEAGAAA